MIFKKKDVRNTVTPAEGGFKDISNLNAGLVIQHVVSANKGVIHMETT